MENTEKLDKVKFKMPSVDKNKARKFFMGSKDKQGFLKLLMIYVLLIGIGFIYLYPILNMVSTSFMSLGDLLDSSINWIPSKLYMANYKNAGAAMKFLDSFKDSIIIAGIPTLIQVVICAIVGYGFARFDFPGKKAMIGFLVFSFILPSQVTMMPTYVFYSNIKLVGSLKAFILPALLGQGLKSQLFILIYYSFFKQVPQALIEAASIDGAGYLKSFFRIALPTAAPGILIVFLFSIVWYWNESYLTKLYVCGATAQNDWTTLIIQLKNFTALYDSYSAGASTTGQVLNSNEGIKMAGTILSILPLLIMYFVMQRNFVESIDKSGITGE